jgi:Tol biopolymer transport system component
VYDLRSGRKRFAFPSGMLSANGRAFVSAVQGEGGTRFVRFDTRTGRARALRTVPGIWTLVGVSADGRRIARFKFRKRARGTTLTLDEPGGSQQVRFPGTYQFESFSPDGRRLFLIHWHRTGSYDLQQYDRASARLSATRLDEPDEKMEGQAQGAVQRRDGSWLYTLYWKVSGGTFIHALDLRTGVAHCIDLPLRGGLARVGASALALSPDEGRLYVASPLAGSATIVDLNALDVSSTARFRRVPEGNFLFGTGPSAAVSPNGRMLAFVTARKLWLMDTAYGLVRTPVRVGRTIVGVGFAPSGRRVVAITDRGHSEFDAATGRRR